MTEFVRFLCGYYRVRIRGAAPEQALNRLTQEHVAFWDIQRIDDFASDISIRRKDLERVQHLAAKVQDGAEVLREAGLLCHIRGLKRRKAFLTAAALILAAAFVLPNFVWCIRVEGNELVPTEQILRELADLGVGFGTWGNSIVPQDLKNRMLNRIPQLEWLTVNRSGGIATVVVRERTPIPEIMDRRRVTNLVATRDCIITQMEVLSGQAVCQVGQTVREGELLVSGYADWEHCIQATRSLGEIYGRTWRKQDAVTPAACAVKGEAGETHTRYALLIGRKRINLYRDSGIWGTGCDKIVTYHPLTLPGNYEFPVTLIEETATERTLEMQTLTPAEAQELLTSGTSSAVRADMVAGEIVRSNVKASRDGSVYRLTGTYECREMVAKSVPAILFESEGNP